MRKIVYYVASSLDGFIAGTDGDISGFVGTGNGVDKYLADLKEFDTVIMGRKTYEFGYRFGLRPGEPAYPHMQHYIFSRTLRFPQQASNVFIVNPTLSALEKIQEQPGTDIYLCGGGRLAGWLLDQQKINRLKIKLNPLVQGQGTRLFGESKSVCKLRLLETQCYEDGLQISSFDVLYHEGATPDSPPTQNQLQ